jgi:hypothetical protein
MRWKGGPPAARLMTANWQSKAAAMPSTSTGNAAAARPKAASASSSIVLGVAYWPDGAPRGSGLGTVIYRIDGGTLDGIWLPEGVHDRAPGHEMLIGSSDLAGRFQITLGRNPWGGRYAGYAELERAGDHVTMTWYLTSSEVFVGNGIKIGNVLAVAYAFRRAPAIAAYCSNGRQLEGGWWTGLAGSSGEETLTPVAGSGAELSSLPNTDDPCHTPIAANW